MEKFDKNIEAEVEKTMASLDHLERVAGNPYLYTQLEGRLKEEEKGIGLPRLLTYAFVALLLCINIATVASCFVRAEQNVSENIAKEFGIKTTLIANSEDF